MANEQYAAVTAALAARGLALRKVDGKWETVEMPGGLSGLPPKLRGISIEFDVPKPKGSAGRGPSAGYNLQDKLAMTTDDYMLVYDDAKTILHRTHGIKLNDCLMKQDRSVVDHAVKKLVTVHSEFEAYRKLGFWPVRAFFYQILRIRSSKYQAASRSKDVAKVRKRRGRPAGKSSKAAVPTGQPAIADPPALKENPVAATQPAPEALQGEDGDNDAEVFDLNIPSDDEDVPGETGLLDTTMGEATKLDLNPNATVNMSCDPRNDDNDDGVFDISQTTGLTLAPQATNTGVPPQKTAPIRSNRSSAPLTAVAHAPAPIRPSSLSSAGPANSARVPTSKLPHKSALAAKHCTPTPPPPPSPPPSSPTSPAPAAAPNSVSAVTTRASPAHSQPAPPTCSSAPTSAPTSTLAPSRPPITKVSPATSTQVATPASVSTPSTHTYTPPFQATGPNIVWHGKTITTDEMEKLRSLAARQAAGSKTRVPQMYKELINLLVGDPNYDPASDPLPTPDPLVPAPGRGRKGAAPARGRKGAAPASAPASNPAPTNAPSPEEKPKARRKPKVKAVPEPEPEPEPEPAPEPELEPIDNDESDLSDPNEGDADEEPARTTSKKGASDAQAGVNKQGAKAGTGSNGKAVGKGKAVAEGERTGKGKGVAKGKDVEANASAAGKKVQSKQAAQAKPAKEPTRRSTRDRTITNKK